MRLCRTHPAPAQGSNRQPEPRARRPHLTSHFSLLTSRLPRCAATTGFAACGARPSPSRGGRGALHRHLYWAIALVPAITLIPAASRPAAAQVPGLQANSGRDCATCHLNWIDSFKQPGAVLLMDVPDHQVVADSDSCLGCHDGAVGDSRRRVWVEHGHRTGIAPPDGMKVPALLPLDSGKLACRTCHTAHSGQGPETLATTVFVRMRNDASQLCVSCHEDKTKGPELGTHPVGGMPWPVPAELVAAGAHQGPDSQRLVCQTCHTPHGSKEHDLLVMGTESSQLCLTCHSRMRPGLWRPDAGREHPQNPPLSSPEMRQAITDMGTKTGAGETLICLSCHKLHHGQAGRYMLADTLHESNLCVRCHPGRQEMFGSSHDLRKSAPAEVNRLGQTPDQSGPCGACHTFHQYARRPDQQPLDPTGLCATCHFEGRVAGHKTGLPFSHPTDVNAADMTGAVKLMLYGPRDGAAQPGFACLTCHNPHETSRRHYLRDEPTQICATCHSERVATLGPQHDFTDRPQLTNARDENAAQAGKCGFCHGIHNAGSPALWVASKQAPANANDACQVCHSPGGLAKDMHTPALRHPSGPGATLAALAGQTGGAHGHPASAPHDHAHTTRITPLFNTQGKPSDDGFVTCATCHDPHGGAGGNVNLLRASQGANADALCAQCHGQAQSMALSLHQPDFMREHFPAAENCAPCHVTHERPGMPATGMWAAPLGPDSYAPAMRQCMGCHSPGGGATPITPTIHPAVVMHTIGAPQDPGYMPLFDSQGRGGATGQIACGTCHVPHGPLAGTAGALAGQPSSEELSFEQLRGLRLMVRPYTAPNLCSACHGFDGLRRYLYYHDPQRRRGTSGGSPP